LTQATIFSQTNSLDRRHSCVAYLFSFFFHAAGEKYADLYLSGAVTMVTHNICAPLIMSFYSCAHPLNSESVNISATFASFQLFCNRKLEFPISG